MNNRRNYYRILHVQPEAPVEVIKASYRSLMTKLNAHPDRGGDHDLAVLINQAYAVLSDPQRRKKYDEMLLLSTASATKRPSGEERFRQQSHAATSNNYQYRGSSGKASAAYAARDRNGCFFCGVAHSAYTANKYCSHCQSPLTSLQSASLNRKQELFGRRTMPRINKGGALNLYPSWPHSGYAGQLQDLSTSGLCLVTAYPAKTGQVLKVDSNFLKGVVRVVTVRASDTNFLVHATFLAAEFITKSGVFFTEKA